MPVTLPVRTIVAALALATAWCTAALAGDVRVNEVERVYADRLAAEGAAALLDERGAVSPEAPLADRVAHVLLLVRAGRHALAATALDELGDAPRETLEGLGEWLIGHERDGLALRLLEARPDVRLGWTYVLLNREIERNGLEATLHWVREREACEPEIWLHERARILRRHGGLEDLLDEQAALVRATPSDVALVHRFVDLVRGSGITYDIEWVHDVVRTSGPLEDISLSRLVLSYAPQAALAFARRATTREIGDVDREGIRNGWSRMAAFRREEPDTDLLLRREARRVLLDALRACGEAAEAQALMEELIAEAGTDAATGLPSPGWLATAGEVQAASGMRVIEGAVREAEEIGQDDPRYWLGRASYFEGRRETDEARGALERALELTADGSDDRNRVAAVDRMSFLIRHAEGKAAAARYLLGELRHCEATGGFAAEKLADNAALAHTIVRTLAFDLYHEVDLVHPVTWRYVEAGSELGRTAERLLRHMAEDTPQSGREAFWDRCEPIARRNAPEARQRLGFAMIVSGDAARAIPFLRESVLTLPEGIERVRCGFLIVRAGLESGDWRAARDAWTVGRRHLGIDERPSRLGRLALLAAKDGAFDDAMDAWRRHANHDAAALALLPELSLAGLRGRLITFYEEWAARDPASDAPPMALAMLRP